MSDFFDFSWISGGEGWIALLTLTVLEVVLGIDNVVFISILAGKLPEHQQARARRIGLLVAMFSRLILLGCIAWVMKLDENPLFSVFGHAVTGKDLVLIVGGLFLLGKATYEIHDKLEASEDRHLAKATASSFGMVLAQVAALDLVFSIDSVITAVGMAKHMSVMALAVIVAVGIMMTTAGLVARYIEKHPTLKMLALSFLLLIGMTLVAEGTGVHVPKGYVYSAMGFSVFVEILNLNLRRKPEKPVALRSRFAEGGETPG